MNKIINGKRYDTETAKRIIDYDNGLPRNDFNFYGFEIYRKKTGELFKYTERFQSEKITRITTGEAKKLAEEYLTGDEYEQIFGKVEE